MNPRKVHRSHLARLEDLPNVGPAMAADFRLLGIHTPDDLRGKDAWALYAELCTRTGRRHDPCVIDVLLSVTSFMSGGKPLPWWHFTAERKRHMWNDHAPR